MKRLALLTFVGLAWALHGADTFSVHAWAGFAPQQPRSGVYTLLFKGHRNLEGSAISYILSLRHGVPEFKYMDTRGNWCGIMTIADGSGRIYELRGRDKTLTKPDFPTVLDDKPWHHLAGVYDKGAVSLYFDGKLVMRTTGNPPSPDTRHPERRNCGEGPDGHEAWRFFGDLRLPAYETRALTDAEVAALYAAERDQLKDEKPVAHALTYPELPNKGEIESVARYFDQLAKNPPAPRGSNCVARIVKVNGIPRIMIDGRVVPAMGMIPQPYENNANATWSCRDFAAQGVKFYSNILWGMVPQNVWWKGEGVYDFDWIDRRMMAMIKAAPEGWVFPRLKIDPPLWWAKAHPEELFCNQVRPNSAKWHALYRRMIADVVTHMENSPYAAYVMGYHIGALFGAEWIVEPIPAAEIPEDRAQRLAWLDSRSKDVADVLLDAAQRVKRLTNRRKLVGSFFGYTQRNHRDFARIVQSPDLDFICAPDSYLWRRGGDAGRSQVAAQASCRLHNKVFWIEADERTHYARVNEPYRCDSLAESVNVAKRTMGYMLAEGWEAWWFLLDGNQTFHDATILDTIGRGNRVISEAVFTAPPRTEADVAVFRRIRELDYGPFSPIGQCADYGDNFYMYRLPRTGVAYDVYVIEDVVSADLPDYKVYVFPDAKTLTSTERAAIRRLVDRKGKTMVTFCADKGHEGARELPNGGRRFDFRRPPATARMRELFAQTGAHRWIDTPDIIAAGRGYLMLHTTEAGEKHLRLPARCDVREIYGLGKPHTGVRDFTEKLNAGETRIYHLTPHQKGK